LKLIRKGLTVQTVKLLRGGETVEEKEPEPGEGEEGEESEEEEGE